MNTNIVDFSVDYDPRRNHFVALDENGRELASVPSNGSITRDCPARVLLQRKLDGRQSPA